MIFGNTFMMQLFVFTIIKFSLIETYYESYNPDASERIYDNQPDGNIVNRDYYESHGKPVFALPDNPEIARRAISKIRQSEEEKKKRRGGYWEGFRY